MPHVIVKMHPGRTEQAKAELSAAIVRDIKSILNVGDDAISVSIEEIGAHDWAEQVYKPDIVNVVGKLYKRPGYNP